MAAQALLLLGRSTDAAGRLDAVSAAVAAEAAEVERIDGPRLAAAARALVAGGDVGRLLGAGAAGPSFVLPELAAMDVTALGRIVNEAVGVGLAAAAPRGAPPLAADSGATLPAAFAAAMGTGLLGERVLFAVGDPARMAAARARIAGSLDRLKSADVAVRAARRALKRETAALEHVAVQRAALRAHAAVERVGIDSIFRELTAVELAVAGRALDGQRDALRARTARARTQLAGMQRQVARVGEALTAAERGGGTAGATTAQTGLARSERARATAERELVAVVLAELETRRTTLLATLRRDAEAAEFGAASAAFLDATRGAPPRPVQVIRPRVGGARAARPRP